MTGPTLALGATGPGPGAHRFSHSAMATVFEVLCFHPDARYAGQAAQAAFEVVDRLEQELSRFIANSDIGRINTLGAGQSSRVGPSTMDCLVIARWLYDATARAFDVAIGSGLESLELDPESFSVRTGADGVQLDLGGIGKGYAVDRMAETLEEWAVPRALVHGGFSSVLALEPPPDQEGWPLTLSAPGPGPHEVLARLSARQRAFSASGTRKGAHVVDPRTGHPVEGGAAWVALPRALEGLEEADWPDPARSPAAVAEGLSTAFMILPDGDVESLCREWPGLEAWVLREPGPGAAAAALVHVSARPG